jgi:hypothetical protein
MPEARFGVAISGDVRCVQESLRAIPSTTCSAPVCRISSTAKVRWCDWRMERLGKLRDQIRLAVSRGAGASRQADPADGRADLAETRLQSVGRAGVRALAAVDQVDVAARKRACGKAPLRRPASVRQAGSRCMKRGRTAADRLPTHSAPRRSSASGSSCVLPGHRHSRRRNGSRIGERNECRR